MAKKHAPRHRAARRPLTPLTGLNTVANRRKAAAVAATGLGVAFVVSSNAVAGEGAKGADVAQLASHAKSALNANPEVSVAKSTDWDASAKTTASVAVEQPRVEAAVARNVEQRRGRGVATVEQADNGWEETSATNISASASGGSVVDIAMRYTGVPYVWAGSTPAGFDCSGFTSYVYRQVGINLPHSSFAQSGYGRAVSRADARPGDLMFWGSGHVGIYVGGNQMIDSSHPGTTIRVRSIWGSPQFRRL